MAARIITAVNIRGRQIIEGAVSFQRCHSQPHSDIVSREELFEAGHDRLVEGITLVVGEDSFSRNSVGDN